MIDRSLRYLVVTRLRNRVRSWLRKLRTVGGVLGLILLALVVAGIVVGTEWGRQVGESERQAVLVTILGFLFVMGVLSGIGQRGLVFSPADLDFLFPAPIRRRHLVAYQFVSHYIAAAVMACMVVFVLGGRYLPDPALFLLGAFLCQVTTAHVTAAAAEASMLLADTAFRPLRVAVIVLIFVLTLGGMILLIAGLAGWGDVSARLVEAVSSDVLRVLLFPAHQAVALGTAPGVGAGLAALGWLALCVVGSFAIVLLLPADVVAGSFAASRRAHKRIEQVRRGVGTAKVKRSERTPRGRWFRGAGAVFWLNWMTLKRQLRATLGGLLVVIVIFTVVGIRGAERPEGALDKTLLALLAMVPLWMPLPIGFRLPREQLAELRGLPLRPVRLAGALLLVPVLAPFALQVAGTAALVAAGRLAPATGLAALPAFLTASGTLLTIEGMFVLRRPHPNAVNLLLSMSQLVMQFLAVLPGLFVLGAVQLATWSTPLALLATALCQTFVTVGLLKSLGRQLQERDLEAALT